MTDNIFFVLGYLLVICLFFVFVYYATKWIGKTASPNYLGKNMKLIEKFNVGIDQTVSLVELDGIHYLIGSTKTNVTLLDKREDLTLMQAEIKTEKHFTDVMNIVRNRKHNNEE